MSVHIEEENVLSNHAITRPRWKVSANQTATADMSTIYGYRKRACTCSYSATSTLGDSSTMTPGRYHTVQCLRVDIGGGASARSHGCMQAHHTNAIISTLHTPPLNHLAGHEEDNKTFGARIRSQATNTRNGLGYHCLTTNPKHT